MWVILSCAARNVWLLAAAYLGAGRSERGISGFSRGRWSREVEMW